ncbi:MAG TPA: sigma-54 dependent transcriptional regulator [Blastocatellia bacterium]|jgi:DNA-binding NtrC family response regulator|nr:sigma-54 dependent transcriptional regulator [Blastocatellia bacterium]
MRERALIAEDNDDMRDLLQEVLEDAGYETLVAANGLQALAHIERESEVIDVVITDVRMPEMTGRELLMKAREVRAEAPVIVITAFGSVEQAVEMVKAGAYQYLTKPFDNREILRLVEEALERSAAQREQARLRRERAATPPRIIGVSRPMRELFDHIALSARSSSTVLIVGESGTGKELIARAIHEMSERKGAFVPVNCAAIPEELIESELFGHTGSAFTGAKQPRAGLIEASDGGTLFLDEVGELPLPVQPKLLRSLQEGAVRRVGANAEQTVDLRVVAATNRDLEQDVRNGRFREDLFWRLNVIRLNAPPLRGRPFDIPLLVEHFVNKAAEAAKKPLLDVSSDALAVLTAYSWPGNVRELENAIERAVAFARGTLITPDDLPDRVRTSGMTSALIARSVEQNMTLRDLEREYILEVLRRTGGNKSRAAELLGLDRKTLYRRLDEYRGEGVSDL